MTAIPFDTLKLARKLEAAGFSAQQAGDTAEALAASLSEGAATTADLARVEASLKSEIELSKRDLKIWLGSIMVVAVGIILAAIRYLPAPHP